MDDKRIKILAAEDDEFLSKVYEIKLAKEGYDVVIARDGEEATQLVKSEKPDLVLLDIVMPKKNGFEVLAEMKQDPELKDIPVIILSNLGQEEDIKRGEELGAEEFVVKVDFTVKDIVGKIQNVLVKHNSNNPPSNG